MTTCNKPLEIDAPIDFHLNPEDGEIIENILDSPPQSPETRVVHWEYCPKKRKFVTGDERKVLLVRSEIDADFRSQGVGNYQNLAPNKRTSIWNEYMGRMFPRPEISAEEQAAKLARRHAYDVDQWEKRLREVGNVTYSDFGVGVDHWIARKD